MKLSLLHSWQSRVCPRYRTRGLVSLASLLPLFNHLQPSYPIKLNSDHSAGKCFCSTNGLQPFSPAVSAAAQSREPHTPCVCLEVVVVLPRTKAFLSLGTLHWGILSTRWTAEWRANKRQAVIHSFLEFLPPTTVTGICQQGVDEQLVTGIKRADSWNEKRIATV